MKKSVLIVAAVAVGIAVIFIVWRVAFYRPAADRSNGDSEAGAGLAAGLTEQAPAPGPPNDPRSRYLSAQETPVSREQKRETLQRMANMSAEEKEQLRAEMRERFRSSRQREAVRFRSVSPEERARLKQQYENVKKRWQSMSEQERREYVAQMRERGRRWMDLSEQEREKIRAEMPNRVDADRQEND